MDKSRRSMSMDLLPERLGCGARGQSDTLSISRGSRVQCAAAGASCSPPQLDRYSATQDPPAPAKFATVEKQFSYGRVLLVHDAFLRS